MVGSLCVPNPRCGKQLNGGSVFHRIRPNPSDASPTGGEKKKGKDTQSPAIIPFSASACANSVRRSRLRTPDSGFFFFLHETSVRRTLWRLARRNGATGGFCKKRIKESCHGIKEYAVFREVAAPRSWLFTRKTRGLRGRFDCLVNAELPTCQEALGVGFCRAWTRRPPTVGETNQRRSDRSPVVLGGFCVTNRTCGGSS